MGIGGLPRVTCQFRSGIRLLFDRIGDRGIRHGNGKRWVRRHGGRIQTLVVAGGQRSPIFPYLVEHEDANGSPHHDDHDQGQPGHHATTTPDRFRRRGHGCRNNGSCYRSDGGNHVSPEGSCWNSNRKLDYGKAVLNPLQAPWPEGQARGQKIGPTGMGVEGHASKEHLLSPVVIDQVGGGDIPGTHRLPHRAHLDQEPAILGEHPILGRHLLDPLTFAETEYARLACMPEEGDPVFRCREVLPGRFLVRHSAIPARLHTLTMDEKDSSGFQGQRTTGQIGERLPVEMSAGPFNGLARGFVKKRNVNHPGHRRIEVPQDDVSGPAAEATQDFRRPRSVTRHITQADRHIDLQAVEILQKGLPRLAVTVDI